MRELPAGQRPDIFWASAPDAFEVMKRDNLLEKASDLANKDVPAKIGNYAINDPDGRYLGQALGGYGLMWNTRYMKANKVPPPARMGRPDQGGLLRPRRAQLALALRHHSPDGGDHPAGRGLGQGLEPAAGDRRQQRPDHRAQLRRARRRQQRPVRHRHGRSTSSAFVGKYSGFPVEFVYPTVTAVVPANIGLVSRRQERRRKRASSSPSACREQARSCCSTRRSRACRCCRPRRCGAKVPAGLSEDLRDRQARQGAVRFGPVGVALLPRLEPVRPDHHLPPQGAAGGHQGDPRRRGRAGEEAERGGQRRW